jgi:hypothetical protein
MCVALEKVVYDGSRYRVVHHRVSDSPDVVVCFEFWLPAPSRNAAPTALEFFVRRGINFIGVMPEYNDWFQDDEILEAIAAIRSATQGARRIGFGGSMGGYAVINFSEDLDLDTTIAICPQFSIDRNKVPFEHRWQDEAAASAFRHDKVARIRPIRRGYAVFDPTGIDAKHFELIARRHPLTPLGVYFAGHEQLRFLTRAGLMADLLLDIIGDRFDRAAFLARVRAVRPHSNLVWSGAAMTLARCGAYARAWRAMQRARLEPLPNPFEADLVEAEILIGLGQRAEAAGLIGKWLNDTALAAVARWHIGRLGLALDAPPVA